MKKILIAHQSTIPHYRIDFYNMVEKMRPPSWSFDVVFDLSELRNKKFFKEFINLQSFNFPLLPVKTFAIRKGEKVFCYQNFLHKTRNYDLVIVGSSLSNITYSFCCWLRKFSGKKYAIWGHAKDRAVVNPKGIKRLIEKLRISHAHNADGFFAYTTDIKEYLENKGISFDKIFVLNNTIDILAQRNYFIRFYPNKEKIKKEWGLEGKKVLLFVGRFTKNKKIDYLLESFANIVKQDSSFFLLLLGSNAESYKNFDLTNVRFIDAIIDLEQLAPLYVVSDVFVFPGDVGLGPLQALCYDLPVVTVASTTHAPEFIYLTSENSIMLPQHSSPEQYALAIMDLFKDVERLKEFKEGIWETISHLTIENMASNFIKGINAII